MHNPAYDQAIIEVTKQRNSLHHTVGRDDQLWDEFTNLIDRLRSLSLAVNSHILDKA